MPDFGIGEALAALFAGGLGEAGVGAGLGAAEAAGAGAGLAGAEAAGGIGALTGATFADSLIPATFGTGAGLAGVEAGAFDVAGALSGAAGAAGAGAGLAGDVLAGAPGLLGGSVPGEIAGAAPGVAGGAGGAGGITPAALAPAGASAGSGLSAGGVAAPAAAAPSASSALDAGLFTGATTSSPASGAIGGGASSVGLPTGATFGESLTPATFGTTAGQVGIDTGAFDTAAASGGGGGIFGSGTSWGDIGSAIKGYGGPAAAIGGLGLSALKGTTPMPGQNAISAQAAALAAQGTKLQSYLDSGTLPPGVGQSITQAADSAKAAIRSRYAQMGGDTSAMHQDLANVDQLASGQGATIALQLLNTGINETQLSSALYGQLLNLAVQQNTQLGSAIGTLATSLTPRVLVAGSQA